VFDWLCNRTAITETIGFDRQERLVLVKTVWIVSNL